MKNTISCFGFERILAARNLPSIALSLCLVASVCLIHSAAFAADGSTATKKVGKYGVYVGESRPNPFGTAPSEEEAKNKPKHVQEYYDAIRRQDRTFAYEDHILVLIKAGSYSEAGKLIQALWDDQEGEVDRTIINSTADELVKILYLEGNLRQAILRRRQSLPYFNSDSNFNRIIELWSLQKALEEKMGHEQYTRDTEASMQAAPFDPDKLHRKIEKMTEFKKGLEKELYSHEYLGMEYLSLLHFDKAENEFRQGLEVFKPYSRSLHFKSHDKSMEQFLRRYLLLVLVLQKKYAEGIQVAKLLDASWTKNNNGDYKRTVKNLQYAIDHDLNPYDLGYGYGLSDKLTDMDMGIYVRDKKYNRLEEPGVGDFKQKIIRITDMSGMPIKS